MTARGTWAARRRLPRPLDAALALAAVALLSPLLALAAMLIVLEDGGPILFRQWRVGKGGEPFRILKFRTMHAGIQGPPITARYDPRVTRVGGWLRALKIDELPQLLNVLNGTMSLIGPRPEVPEYVQFDEDLWRTVLAWTPGITDLASLAYRDEEAILAGAPDRDAYYRAVVLPEKLRLNVRYQEARCLTSDLKLLWMTARYSFFPRGFDRDRVLRALGGEGRRGSRLRTSAESELP
jgi:lipopolysaccharide/colanic/teichoic acid biosynthesis glycosyltransferase